jgi:hypothetical protein
LVANAEEKAMRFTAIAALILSIPAPALAQDWTPFISREEGFSANYPGPPKVEAVSYATEYRQRLPGRIYSAADAMGRYSTTVIDYRGAEKLHNDTVAKCQAAKGANLLDGDACQNDFRVEVAGAMDYAAWNFMKRDGVKLTHYMWYFNEMVAGRLLQLTNPDQSRTYAVIHQHAGRLYIHQATVNRGSPEPILFMQSIGWVDEEGRSIRYRTFYTEGYGEWQFPHPIPPRTVRGVTAPVQ